MAIEYAETKINNALWLFSLGFIGKESIYLACKIGLGINYIPVALLTERLTGERVWFSYNTRG